METSLLVGMKATRRCLARTTGCEQESKLLSKFFFSSSLSLSFVFFCSFGLSSQAFFSLPERGKKRRKRDKEQKEGEEEVRVIGERWGRASVVACYRIRKLPILSLKIGNQIFFYQIDTTEANPIANFRNSALSYFILSYLNLEICLLPSNQHYFSHNNHV